MLTTAPAFADTAIGLSGDKTLVMIDTATAAVTGTMDVTGVDSLLGIDWRPGNKTLVGVTGDHTIVTIDPATGAATEVAKMNELIADVPNEWAKTLDGRGKPASKLLQQVRAEMK